jgi:acyl-CoA synthetase (AMP-forming)/AMP-acid ligase II
MFPDKTKHPSGDPFSPHPSRPNLWQFCGRADNMQCFVNGEKFYSIEMERVIGSHPDVSAVLFIGTRRPKDSLLIELPTLFPIETLL